MADNQHHYGFRAFRPLYPNAHYPDPEVRVVATAYQAQDDGSGFSVDLNIGDPVKLVSDGSVALCNTTQTPDAIIVGVKQYWDGTVIRTDNNKLPGATAWGTVEERRSEVLVLPVNAAIWAIDVDDSSTATTEAAYRAFVGENVTHTCAGDSATAKAEPRIDISAHATTATLEWRIVGVVPGPENKDFSGANVKLLVQANLHTRAGAAATPATGV